MSYILLQLTKTMYKHLELKNTVKHIWSNKKLSHSTAIKSLKYCVTAFCSVRKVVHLYLEEENSGHINLETENSGSQLFRVRK